MKGFTRGLSVKKQKELMMMQTTESKLQKSPRKKKRASTFNVACKRKTISKASQLSLARLREGNLLVVDEMPTRNLFNASPRKFSS